MSDDHYHGVKTLLSQVSVGSLYTLTTLADAIVNQVNLGSVVSTQDGESGVVGFGTILNISQHSKVPGMISFRSFLSDLAKKLPKHSKIIHQILSGNPSTTTGLLLKERLVNFPPELTPNLHQVLIDDAKWSLSDEFEPDEGEKREFYDFDYIIALSSFEIEGGGKSVEEGDQQPMDLGHKKKRKLDKKNAAAGRLYLHWEDEIFNERALFSHSWQNAAKPVVYRANKKYTSYFLLYALRYSDYVDLCGRLSLVQ
jgi:hypothetical protein